MTDCRSIVDAGTPKVYEQQCNENRSQARCSNLNSCVFLEDRFFTFQLTIYCFLQTILALQSDKLQDLLATSSPNIAMFWGVFFA